MQNGSDEKVKIYRFWSQEWEDISYEEEIELTNILCHQCAGLDATKMNKEDFRNLAVNCCNEIFRKVGRFAGKLPLPVFNNKEYSLFGTIGIDKHGKATICYYADKSEKRIEYIYTGETIYES